MVFNKKKKASVPTVTALRVVAAAKQAILTAISDPNPMALQQPQAYCTDPYLGARLCRCV